MPDELGDHRAELARRLCAALVSKRLGIGMDYALKNYVKNAGQNEYWLELADRIEREFAEQSDRTSSGGRRSYDRYRSNTWLCDV
jgi:hypothetical protein